MPHGTAKACGPRFVVDDLPSCVDPRGLVRRLLPLAVSLVPACQGAAPGLRPDANDVVPDSKRIVILMIGDGMGRGQRDAASLFAHGGPGELFLENLPVRGTVITSGPSGTT